MRLSSGRRTCDCCKAANNLEFGKIMEMKDVGVAVYQYLPQAHNENQNTTGIGQLYILQNSSGDDVKLEEVIVESEKKKISCPRCMKSIQHVKSLLMKLPPARIREITGICDHCYQKEFFNCPCCKVIVDKFVKFRIHETKQLEEERERNKSWLIKTHLSLKKSFSSLKDSKPEPRTRSEGWIQESQIPASRYIPTKEPVEEPAPFLEMYEKHRFRGETEPIYEQKKYQEEEEILEKSLRVLSFLDFPEDVSKPKPKKEKTGILKSREDGASGGVIKPYDTMKRTVSPPKQHSFEAIMKSLSEPNVSDFSYSFPHEFFFTKNQIKRQVSSSELIKNTQEMLQERKAAEKLKQAELKRLLKEEKKRLTEEGKRKREEEKAIKDKEPELQDEDGDKPTKSTKQDEIAATSALKELLAKQTKETLAEEKARKQSEKDKALGEKKTREAEKKIDDREKQTTTERIRKQAVSDVEVGLTRGGKEKEDKSEKLDKKDKGQQQKQADLAATSALKDQVAKQAKEKSKAEKMTKQTEEAIALGEIKARDAEKAIEENQKQLGRKSELPLVKPAGEGEKEKDENLEKSDKEQKVKDNTHSEMSAALKAHMDQKKKQEFEKEKLQREQQKERELAEKKLRDLQLTMEGKVSTIKPPILIPEVISDEDDGSVSILQEKEVTDIIKGQKICSVKSIKRAESKQSILESKQAEQPRQKTIDTKQAVESRQKNIESKQAVKRRQKTVEEEPVLPKHYSEQSATTTKPPKQFSDNTEHVPTATSPKKSQPSPRTTDNETAKGVVVYTLSDRTFIDKGWTMLPTEKVVRKMNVYRMRPAKPEFDWFEHNKYKREMTYDSGEKLAEFDDNGRGRWYYRSGELALDYYDAEETNAGQRFVVYSTGQPDERGRSHPRTILATFDYSGNGIVFDHAGKIRLKYNQTEGVVLDRTIGPVSHWKWHTLNDPPVLQQVMIDTQMPYKDPTILKMGDKNADQKRPDNEEMVAIEFENFLKEKRQKLTQSFKPFQIKMKAMKINENFSLRVLDQASVYLLFREGATNLKINIGMILDHKEIVDTDTAEIGEVSNTLDKLPACTDSIAGLQKAVAQAQAAERTRVRHERRLKRPEETASADALRAGCSRPLRTPVLQPSLTSCDKMTPKRFKPPCCALYYSTQDII